MAPNKWPHKGPCAPLSGRFYNINPSLIIPSCVQGKLDGRGCRGLGYPQDSYVERENTADPLTHPYTCTVSHCLMPILRNQMTDEIVMKSITMERWHCHWVNHNGEGWGRFKPRRWPQTYIQTKELTASPNLRKPLIIWHAIPTSGSEIGHIAFSEQDERHDA